MKSDCLTREDLQKAIFSGAEIDWHPDYKEYILMPGPFRVIEVIPRGTQNPFYEIVLCPVIDSTQKIRRNITEDGRGEFSKAMMFKWKEDTQYSVTKVTVTLPKNNDGRSECAFCGAPTRKAGGGAYDICTKCGK